MPSLADRGAAQPPLGTSAGLAVDVRVPASSANLGPGFDTFGLALSVYNEYTVRVVDGAGGVNVRLADADGVALSAPGEDLMVTAMARAFERAGRELPGLDIEGVIAIPMGSGLGSSAAAIVGGLMAAKGLLEGAEEPLTALDHGTADGGRLDGDALLALATELEGHPDNVAPALLGGLTIAWGTPTGPRAKKFNVHRGVAPLIAVPDFSVPTKVARALQPVSVPYEDAVFNLSRSALLIAALVQSPELLFEATDDKLHQTYRASAMPETNDLVHRLRAAGLPAVVSGAGPSILVLGGDPALRAQGQSIIEAAGAVRWTVLTPAVDFKGATVSPHRPDVP